MVAICGCDSLFVVVCQLTTAFFFTTCVSGVRKRCRNAGDRKRSRDPCSPLLVAGGGFDVDDKQNAIAQKQIVDALKARNRA